MTTSPESSAQEAERGYNHNPVSPTFWRSPATPAVTAERMQPTEPRPKPPAALDGLGGARSTDWAEIP